MHGRPLAAAAMSRLITASQSGGGGWGPGPGPVSQSGRERAGRTVKPLLGSTLASAKRVRGPAEVAAKAPATSAGCTTYGIIVVCTQHIV